LVDVLADVLADVFPFNKRGEGGKAIVMPKQAGLLALA